MGRKKKTRNSIYLSRNCEPSENSINLSRFSIAEFSILHREFSIKGDRDFSIKYAKFLDRNYRKFSKTDQFLYDQPSKFLENFRNFVTSISRIHHYISRFLDSLPRIFQSLSRNNANKSKNLKLARNPKSRIYPLSSRISININENSRLKLCLSRKQYDNGI